MSRLVIFGLGSVARFAHYQVLNDSEYTVSAFTVDAEYCNADEFSGVPLVSFDKVQNLFPPNEYDMFIAIGYKNMNRVRAEKYYKAKEMGYRLPTLISHRCTNYADRPIGDNCLIMDNVVIQPFTKIGSNNILISSTFVAHDVVIDDHCFIAPSKIGGYAHIGSNSFIGLNATILNEIKVAPFSLIGAGALIKKDTVEKGVYSPRRTEVLDRNSDEIQL
jgi:sugar O-acyltransferase (sialic acid O-acetyltransferase NeuD family)